MLNHKHEGNTKLLQLQHRIAQPLALFYLIPRKFVIFAGTSTQIIRIGPRNNCANFHAFSTMRMIYSPFFYTISMKLHALSIVLYTTI